MNTLKHTYYMKTFSSLFLIFVLISACGNKDKKAQLAALKDQQAKLQEQIENLELELSKTDSTSSNRKTKSVLVSPVSIAPFQHYVQVQGKVDAEESVNISSKMGGEISKIYVTEGQEVRAGQVLAETDNKVMLQGIQELKSQLDFATVRFSSPSAGNRSDGKHYDDGRTT